VSAFFEPLFNDLRGMLHLAADHKAEPRVTIIDSQRLRSRPESRERAGYCGGKRKNSSKNYMAVYTLRHLSAR